MRVRASTCALRPQWERYFIEVGGLFAAKWLRCVADTLERVVDVTSVTFVRNRKQWRQDDVICRSYLRRLRWRPHHGNGDVGGRRAPVERARDCVTAVGDSRVPPMLSAFYSAADHLGHLRRSSRRGLRFDLLRSRGYHHAHWSAGKGRCLATENDAFHELLPPGRILASETRLGFQLRSHFLHLWPGRLSLVTKIRTENDAWWGTR